MWGDVGRCGGVASGRQDARAHRAPPPPRASLHLTHLPASPISPISLVRHASPRCARALGEVLKTPSLTPLTPSLTITLAPRP